MNTVANIAKITVEVNNLKLFIIDTNNRYSPDFC